MYLPDPDYVGPDAFTYRPSDGDLEGEPVAVSIDVLPVNDPPRPGVQQAQTAPGTPVRLQLSAGDPEDGAVWLMIEAFPDVGHLDEFDPANAAVRYVPPAGYVGEARFAYRLSDGRDVSDVYEARVRVE